VAAHRALELDPNQAYAHMILGVNKLMNELDMDASDFHLDEALRLRPNDYFILSSVGSFRIRSGRVDEGLALMKQSIDINPADGAAMWFYSTFLDSLHMYDDAIERAQHVVALLPDTAFGYVNLAFIAARAGKEALAREAIRKALARQPNVLQMANIAWAYTHLGDRSAAAAIVSDLRRDYVDFPIPIFHVNLHIIMGEYQQAIDMLEKLLNDPVDGGLIRANFYQDVRFSWNEELHALPAYRALVKRVQAEVDGLR
jgi:tetratricopeptide (TPR) repeat protein